MKPQIQLECAPVHVDATPCARLAERRGSRIGLSLFALLWLGAAVGCPAKDGPSARGDDEDEGQSEVPSKGDDEPADDDGDDSDDQPADDDEPPPKKDAGGSKPSDAGTTRPRNDAGGGSMESDAARPRDAAADSARDAEPSEPGEPTEEPTDPGDEGSLNTAPVKFGKNVRIDDDTGNGMQTEVVIATRPDGLILAGWIDQRSGGRCGYSISKDGGTTWGKNFFAASQGASGSGRPFAGDPAVAIDDAGNLYIACQDYASGGLGTNYILFAASRDDGATFTPFKRIRQTLDKPWLGATGDGTVYLSWLGSPGGFMRSRDHGQTWSTPASLGNLNHGTGISATDKGLVHVAYDYANSRVHYRRSTDFGLTLSAAKEVSSQGRSCFDPCSPRNHPIVANASDPTGKVVAITWTSTMQHEKAEGDDDVWVIVSQDGGDTWTKPIRANDNTARSRQFQSWVAVDKYGAVHVVWTDLRNNGQFATYYARMTDVTKGFEPNVEVTDARGRNTSFLGDYKGIAVQGRDIVVAWQDTRSGQGDIYFARAVDAAAAGGPLAGKP